MAIKRLSLKEKLEQPQNAEHNNLTKMEGRVIMGIDPGTNVLGYAVIKISSGKPTVLVYGVVSMSKFTDPYQKLSKIFSRLSVLIEQYHPHEMALEAPFYSTNVQSMLKLGRAQGVAMSAALSRGIDVFEYMPTEVKQSVAGQGRASKEQVAGILHHLLGIDPSAEKLDATDALSVALCHFFRQSSPSAAKTTHSRSKNNGWDAFINKQKT